MSDIEIHPITSKKERRLFLTFPWVIYKDDPLWVPPILSERARVIDPEHGQFFERGEADFFIAWRNGKPVGTICAAEDPPTNQNRGTKECVIGFFEYIHDYAVFEGLVNHAIQWAEKRGLNALFGPFNLDYEDGYGVLIEGRDRPPVLLCGHTPPYYQDFIERFGLQPARGDNLAYAVSLGEETPALKRLSRLAERLRRQGAITIRSADLDSWQDEIERVYLLINRALAHLPDHVPWRRDELEALLKPFRAVVDPELILFAEAGGQPVGWFPGIPNLYEPLQHANGLRYPWDYLRLGWYARRQPACLAIKSVLVLPEYWNTGVSVLLFDEMARRARAKGFKWVDLSLTSADNPNTPMLADRLGAKLYKRYRVYRLCL